MEEGEFSIQYKACDIRDDSGNPCDVRRRIIQDQDDDIGDDVIVYESDGAIPAVTIAGVNVERITAEELSDCDEEDSNATEDEGESDREFYHEDGYDSCSFLDRIDLIGSASDLCYDMNDEGAYDTAAEEEDEEEEGNGQVEAANDEPDQNELEYEYEPGISLRHLEFAKHPDLKPSSTCHGVHCADYENGKK